MGFFESTTVAASSKTKMFLVPRCGACGIYKTCKTPKMPVSGKGRKEILIVAEAPGKLEDEEGVQLIGEPGKYLRQLLLKFDVDVDRDCWKTNSLICHPPEGRSPTNDEIDYCRPNVTAAIKELNPRIVIPLGAAAVRSVLAPFWKENVGALGDWVGWRIPVQENNTWITPNYHPSYIIQSEKEKNGPVKKVWFERYLEQTLLLEKRPWGKLPRWEEQIRIVIDPREAAEWIRKITRAGGPSSFDYETNMIKPDRKEAEIVSCAICWRGRETVAYPWVGEAIEATKEYLISDSPKLGANTKFESRWSFAKLGVEVNNWKWDTMILSHVLDNRGDINSVKFQSFVRLGVSPWDEIVKPYFEAENSDGTNNIRRIDLRTLLKYNGQDAVYEYFLACEQRKAMQL